MVAAELVRDLGDFAVATTLAEEGAARAAAAGDEGRLAETLIVLGGIAQAQSDSTTAAARFEEALARYRALGDGRNTARALCRLATLGNLESVDQPGDPDDQALATARCEEALRLFEALDDAAGIARALHGLAFVAYKARDYPRATSLSHETLRRRWDLHEIPAIPASFEDLADIAGMTGQARTAARLYGAAEALREIVAVPLRPFHLAEYEREVAMTRAALEPAIFTAEWAAGRALPLADAVAEALAVTVSTGRQSARAVSADHGLSPRELEVLRLLVEGRSDREIGEALFLSPRTVGRHITGILTKLQVPSRTAAATLAVREGMV